MPTEYSDTQYSALMSEANEEGAHFDSLEQSVKEEFDALLSDTKEKYGDDMP